MKDTDTTKPDETAAPLPPSGDGASPNQGQEQHAADAGGDMQLKMQEYLQGWQRAQADYQNLKKDLERQRTEFVKFATMDLISALVEVYSHLKLALLHVPADHRKDPWVVGFSHVAKQFIDLLKSRGVEEIPTVGAAFDPHVHEAVVEENVPLDQGEMAADGSRPDPREQGSVGTATKVVKEVKPGFVLYGQVICPAKVVVSSAVSAPETEGAPEEGR